MNLLNKVFAKFHAVLLYPFLFKKYGKKSLILSPLSLEGKFNIEIGQHVIIQEHSWLAALPLTGSGVELIVKDESVVGHYCHIYATKSIIIEKNVLIADKVYISDNVHSYDNIDIPIKNQPIKQCNSVRIGESSWIGENVCVIGASVGRHCVIGANSVVTKDIPDYSVAVGVPAKVIKKYNFETQIWEKVE
mgnify:CR=1 FL=1